MNHDQIFYETYRQKAKRSLTVILGRHRSMWTAFLLTLMSYSIVILAIPAGLLPLRSLAVMLSLPLFARQTQLYRARVHSPPHYVNLTVTTFLLSVAFGLLLSLGLVLG